MNRKNAFFQKHILNSSKLTGTPKVIASKIYESMFNFNRMRETSRQNVTKLLEHMVRKQRNFNYNYYLSKNCPMPDQWHERKDALMAKAAESPA
jgi:hypothetical protein